MRKLIVFITLVVIAMSAAPAGATSDPAYFAAYSNHGTLPYKTWKALDASYFETIQNGVVELNGATFSPTITGLINISGICQLKNPPGLWVMAITVNGSAYYVISANDPIETIDITLPAGDMVISSYQEYTGGANAIKCALLFDAVP